MPGRLPDPPPGLGRRLAQRLARPSDDERTNSARTDETNDASSTGRTDSTGSTESTDEAAVADDRWEDRTWSE
ncbi:hypothetical protein [Cellulomonas uda]|uniref:hypothetical protein n=1 Tax=Cellulomonas uda TaxID=1714 RepID=UPI0011419B06|nr:hypothetical protein [Cellulomonas uda]NII67167.1 hypothetical protein [Cellulomonas uda]